MVTDKRFLLSGLAVAAFAAAFSGSAWAQNAPIKMGVLASLEGPLAVGGAEAMRGAELALKQYGGAVAGRKVEVLKASSDITKPETAMNSARKLVEQDKVDILVGPLSGSEGIAIKDYSRSQPQVTFIDGSSGAQATTLVNPSPNFFRFHTEGAQWMVGLGKAALGKGYKKVMVIGDDYDFPYSQVQGFMTEYCKNGGRVPAKAWVPLGTKDYAAVIGRVPKDVDALLLVLGGSDAVNFLNQYEAAGGDKPILGGSIMVSQDVLNYRGKRRDSLVGTLSAGAFADSYDGAEWKKFVADYQKNFPVAAGGFPSPTVFAYMYYVEMKAALDGLAAVNGDLSGNQLKYRQALSKMVLKTPTGDIRLDANRQAVGATFITEVAKDAQGNLYNKVHSKVENVDQTLGLAKADFKIGSRDYPNCP